MINAVELPHLRDDGPRLDVQEQNARFIGHIMVPRLPLLRGGSRIRIDAAAKD
jgi:hypothetical protein